MELAIVTALMTGFCVGVTAMNILMRGWSSWAAFGACASIFGLSETAINLWS